MLSLLYWDALHSRNHRLFCQKCPSALSTAEDRSTCTWTLRGKLSRDICHAFTEGTAHKVLQMSFVLATATHGMHTRSLCVSWCLLFFLCVWLVFGWFWGIICPEFPIVMISYLLDWLWHGEHAVDVCLCAALKAKQNMDIMTSWWHCSLEARTAYPIILLVDKAQHHLTSAPHARIMPETMQKTAVRLWRCDEVQDAFNLFVFPHCPWWTLEIQFACVLSLSGPNV